MTRTIPAPLPQAHPIDFDSLSSLLSDGSVELVCVLGPTASGKTKYAVKLAGELKRRLGKDCEIISADSRQVYRGMNIGTGKDLCEYGDIRYHLIDIVDCGQSYNVFRFKEDFSKAVSDIRSRDCVPILCGGTGLYISAVTLGYDFSGKKPLSEPWENVLKTYFIGTSVSREERNKRIDKRLAERLQEGMVDEIKGLLDNGVSADKLISYGLEYKFVTNYILGKTGYDEMVLLLATAIHQFAKRQMTWWRGMERSGIEIHWTEVE